MIIDTTQLPAVYPVGLCYCGCGTPTDSPDRYFISAHDRRAEAKVVSEMYGNIATFVSAHGGGPTVPPRAPTGADDLPLLIGDRVTADSHTGRFTGTITAIHKAVALYCEDDGTTHSAVFSRFTHEPDRTWVGGDGEPLHAGDKVTANIRGGPYPGSTITSVRSNGEMMFIDASGEIHHGRPERFIQER